MGGGGGGGGVRTSGVRPPLNEQAGYKNELAGYKNEFAGTKITLVFS